MQVLAWRKFSRAGKHILFFAAIGFVFIVLFLLLSRTALANGKKSQVSFVTGEKATLRTEPNEESPRLLELPRGEEVLVEKWSDAGYCEVLCGNVKGYIDSVQLKAPVQVLTFTPSLAGTVNADGVNLRVKSDKEATIISLLKRNASVEISSMVGDWYCVSADGQVGYVFRDYVDISADDTSLEVGYKTLKMGTTGKEVARLQQALFDAGYFDGDVSGNYGARTRDAVAAYQVEKGLNVDGTADESVQKALFS